MIRYAQPKKKLTGKDWSSNLSIRFIDISGFPNEDYFNKVYIDKETFLLYASNCSIEKPLTVSRREASKLKNKLSPKD